MNIRHGSELRHGRGRQSPAIVGSEGCDCAGDRPRAAGARSFTLIEVVLALMLIVVLLGSMVTFIWDLSDRRTTLSRGARDVAAGGAIVERIEADLLSGLAGDNGVGAGVKGTATTLRLLSRGAWMSGDGAGADGDLQGSEYAFDPATGKLSASRWSQRSGEEHSAEDELVSDRVERVRFRFFDGREWRSEFDSLKEDALPVAVEVAVWFTALKNSAAPVAGSLAGGSAVEANPADGNTVDASRAASERKWPEPDRLRVIIVPDGPRSAWSDNP
jgi:hypothetical protein